jgi:hypothetical protein
LIIAAFSLFMTGRGVPAGATMPFQLFASYPGKPASATVGTSGNALARRSPATAIARSLAFLTWGTVLIAPPNITFTELGEAGGEQGRDGYLQLATLIYDFGDGTRRHHDECVIDGTGRRSQIRIRARSENLSA